MALFRGQQRRQQHHGGHASPGSQRHYDRGRSRGRGRGRGAPLARHGERNAFYESRVEEQSENVSGIVSQISQSDVEELHSLSPSDESEDEPSVNTNKPYSSLLQSLNANIQRQGPPHKKRKIDLTGALSKTKSPRSTANDTVELDDEEDEEEAENANDDESPFGGAEENTIEDHSDLFTKHFIEAGEEGELSTRIADVREDRWHLDQSPTQGEWSFSYKSPESKIIPANEWAFAATKLESVQIKERLRAAAARIFPRFDQLTAHLASSITAYRDVLFPLRTLQKADTLRKLVCLHSLNHVFKTRDKVIKNNARLMKSAEEADIELRDQGFTRPKVLIILPTRQSCVRYVDTIMLLCEPEQQENSRRFQDMYGTGDDDLSQDKPEDFKELFAGNDDDMFRLGMKFTRKTVKVFSQFYSSDIIFASPLGLRMALGGDAAKKEDHDFLSSIEIVIVDQTDALRMQNWEHIEYIFENLNLQPKEAHGCDFSRVKNWYLDGNAKYFRQTILFSAFNFPSLNRLYLNRMLNIDGKAKYFKAEEGAMIGLGITPQQKFSRFDFASPTSEPDDRFKYFSSAIIPALLKGSRRAGAGESGVLIYLPCYADFVRIRNFMATSATTQDISFGSISEYTSVKDVARARSHFLSGRHSVLLYTERAHHFRRYHLKGVKRVIMYGLPENPVFYKEVVGGFLGASIGAAKIDVRETSVRALFSKLDVLKLERIVGSSRYLSMLKEKGGDTFDFI